MIEDLKSELNKLDKLLTIIIDKKLDLNIETSEVFSFKKRKVSHYKSEIGLLIKKVRRIGLEIKNKEIIDQINEIERFYLMNKTEELSGCVKATKEISNNLKMPKATISKISSPTLPYEINDEVNVDLKEIEKCYNVGGYRSTTILCGRILETALHRKYFDITGKDILETNPGIGLGKLIAKLKEKNVDFAPGVTEQIHLINQIRVFSVHKKSETFNPSKQQAQAMILYTVDILKRLFTKKSD
jgi:hypothetical protein